MDLLSVLQAVARQISLQSETASGLLVATLRMIYTQFAPPGLARDGQYPHTTKQLPLNDLPVVLLLLWLSCTHRGQDRGPDTAGGNSEAGECRLITVNSSQQGACLALPQRSRHSNTPPHTHPIPRRTLRPHRSSTGRSAGPWRRSSRSTLQ